AHRSRQHDRPSLLARLLTAHAACRHERAQAHPTLPPPPWQTSASTLRSTRPLTRNADTASFCWYPRPRQRPPHQPREWPVGRTARGQPSRFVREASLIARAGSYPNLRNRGFHHRPLTRVLPVSIVRVLPVSNNKFASGQCTVQQRHRPGVIMTNILFISS